MNSTKISEEELRAFIGKNSEYYIDKFKKFEEGKSISWNWSAFLFGVLWMFYRKMYVYGLIALAVIFIINVFIAALGINQVISTGISLWLWIGFGMFGNYIYYIFVKNKIKKIKENTRSDNILEILSKKGGVNRFVLYFFSAFAIIYLLLIILYVFLN
ncbi:DUF2628 domain-containing protein [Persephonella sp.]